MMLYEYVRAVIYAPSNLLLLAAVLAVSGCQGARIADPLPSHRDPVTEFTVEFHPNYARDSFHAFLDEVDWTDRFTPKPEPGETSTAPITEPFWGGSPYFGVGPTVQPAPGGAGGGTGGGTQGGAGVPAHYKFEHTLRIDSEATSQVGFTLQQQRSVVKFTPVHVVFDPNLITFQSGKNTRPSVCLVPAPTRAVEVVVMPSQDAPFLKLGSQPAGQATIVRILPSADPQKACTALDMSAEKATRQVGIFGVCNGCQYGSANVIVTP